MSMTGTTDSIAVVAHFDPENRFDATFETLLDCLLQVCDHVLVVSTCSPTLPAKRFDNRVECIFRPNAGYDFYSYKVGIQHITSKSWNGSLFLVNSSFLITDRNKFIATLKEIKAPNNDLDMTSVTQSLQMGYHLQSYLLHLSPDARNSAWFADWVCSIQPRNSKQEIIALDEIGLSIKAKQADAKIGAWFNGSRIERRHGALRWAKHLIQQKSTLQLLRPRTLLQFNPVHFLAKAVSTQCGLVKTELVRNNPCKQDLTWLNDPQLVPEAKDIHAFTERSRRFYVRATSGLTVFASAKEGALPSCRLILSGPCARPGVKIAVALHLFYPELIDEIREYLRNIIEPFDLFVTTPHEGAVHLVLDRFADTAATICVALSENRGRDIGPFLTLQKRKLFDPYDAVLKIHGKRSKYSDSGDLWRKRLFKELIGNQATAEAAIRLIRTPSCGMVGPHDDYLTNPQYWGANRETVSHILNSLHPENKSEIPLGFFAGSMFWFKPKAIYQCAELIETTGLSFEPENGKQDGTLAHAVERVFCNMSTYNNLEATTIKLNGTPISSVDSSSHSTPVIHHKSISDK